MQKWGNRTLEDNWRRSSKVTSSAFEDTEIDYSDNDSIPTDSLAITEAKQESVDPKDPQFYLQQIPKTNEAVAASNAQIADALYAMIHIYQNKLEDETLAEETYQEFRRRFSSDDRLLELYYRQYLNKLKLNDIAGAQPYKDLILAEFPESEEAHIVTDPNYFDRLRRMALEQDSLYQITYEQYKKGGFAAVKNNKVYAEENYPFSPLMPKFLFLNAVAVAKTEGQPAFIEALRDMVTRYPTSDVGAMAKDMLAMMNQGMESQQGGSVNSLTEHRTTAMEVADADTTAASDFSTERNEQSYLYLCLEADETQLNNLLYQVALFNFSQFMIKDFDLKAYPIFHTSGLAALQILGFDSLDEAEWYRSMLENNADLKTYISDHQVQVITITDTNSKLLYNPFTLDEYNNFLNTTTAPKKQ